MDELNENDVVFLKPRAKLQPLSCRWPAWPHLLAPAQHAMNIAYRHASNRRSFVTTPSVLMWPRVAILRKMLGGPFVPRRRDVGLAREPAEIEMTKSVRPHDFRFAEDYRALNDEASGAARRVARRTLLAAPPSLAGSRRAGIRPEQPSRKCACRRRSSTPADWTTRAAMNSLRFRARYRAPVLHDAGG